MSINKNRQLMENQVKRLKGVLNENTVDISVTHDIVDKLFWKMTAKLEKTLKPLYNKRLKGKVIKFHYDKNFDDIISPVVEVKEVDFQQDYDGLKVVLTILHKDGTVSELDNVI